MRAHHIMTRKVITVKADTPIRDAANLMLQQHISGLPVVDEADRLIGVVSEGDFIRRSEIGTQRPRIRWLEYLMGVAGKVALDFVHEPKLHDAVLHMRSRARLGRAAEQGWFHGVSTCILCPGVHDLQAEAVSM